MKIKYHHRYLNGKLCMYNTYIEENFEILKKIFICNILLFDFDIQLIEKKIHIHSFLRNKQLYYFSFRSL
jgi:hypothetical protein